MTRLVVDTALSVKLHDLTETVALCDESGHVFGHFVPSINLSDWEPASEDISEEELDRRARSTERRYTTAEVLDYLAGLSTRDTP